MSFHGSFVDINMILCLQFPVHLSVQTSAEGNLYIFNASICCGLFDVSNKCSGRNNWIKNTDGAIMLLFITPQEYLVRPPFSLFHCINNHGWRGINKDGQLYIQCRVRLIKYVSVQSVFFLLLPIFLYWPIWGYTSALERLDLHFMIQSLDLKWPH